MFSVDFKTKYPVKEPNNAVLHGKAIGFAFGGMCLNIRTNQMNGNEGKCSIQGAQNGDVYKVPKDENGNSILTGEGKAL